MEITKTDYANYLTHEVQSDLEILWWFSQDSVQTKSWVYMEPTNNFQNSDPFLVPQVHRARHDWGSTNLGILAGLGLRSTQNNSWWASALKNISYNFQPFVGLKVGLGLIMS